MPSAPSLPFPSSRSKPATKWVIRLGAEDGSAPTDADETQALRWPVVHRKSGSKLDHCDLTYALDANNERIVDVYLKQGFARQLEVVQLPTDPTKPSLLIFWGEIGTQKLSVKTKAESIAVTATVENYHFGTTLESCLYRDPDAPSVPILLNDPLVFNPLIDDKIEANRSKYSYEPVVNQERYFWVHPDSVRTTAARISAQDNEQAELWSLADAIRTVTWQCNPDETFIKNPTHIDLDLWLADAPAVKNLELPSGEYLPVYLDQILNPAGYGWALTYKFEPDTATPPVYSRVVSYRIFKLNDDNTTTVLQQRPGDNRGVRNTLNNVLEFDIETAISGQANEVMGLGDFQEYEVTIELYRGWTEAQDSLAAVELTQSTGASWPANQRAWRLWPANEGGDYCDTRTSVAPIPSTPLPLWQVFGGPNYTAKRRQALNCLTYYKDDGTGEARRRRPPLIEYWTASGWAALPDGWGETVLDDQIAVYFAGDSVPSELRERGDDARLRITCVVQSDRRLSYTADREQSSVNLRTSRNVIDVSDRYKYRKRVKSGDFSSSLYVASPTSASDEQDDSVSLIDFIDKLREVEDAAITRGKIKLIGLALHYKVGQTLKEIKGRDISLNRMARGDSKKKYLQIVGVTLDLQNQTTILNVAPILEAIA